jgi:hypothetical protein
LERLFAGLLIIGLDRKTAMQAIIKVTMDSTPRFRLKTYEALTTEWQTTRKIATAIQLPRSTTHRSLEDLTAQGLVLRKEKEDKGADEWKRCPAKYTSDEEAADEAVPQNTVDMVNDDLSPSYKMKNEQEGDFAGQPSRRREDQPPAAEFQFPPHRKRRKSRARRARTKNEGRVRIVRSTPALAGLVRAA